MEILKTGTRKSPLALKQVEELEKKINAHFPGVKLEPVGIDTTGDRDRKTPIDRVEGTDFFTDSVERALAEGKVDIAQHSAKDLPREFSSRLEIPFITDSIDPDDVLVSRGNLNLDQLAEGAIIGTSSKRRKQGLKNFRPDFKITDIRGNIHQRLKLLDDSKNLDAIVIAIIAFIFPFALFIGGVFRYLFVALGIF
ncbi:MAG: hydroxymethylbilane synthase [Elusimicrobiota bacterium]